jgi:hypothetical protein
LYSVQDFTETITFTAEESDVYYLIFDNFYDHFDSLLEFTIGIRRADYPELSTQTSICGTATAPTAPLLSSSDYNANNKNNFNDNYDIPSSGPDGDQRPDTGNFNAIDGDPNPPAATSAPTDVIQLPTPCHISLAFMSSQYVIMRGPEDEDFRQPRNASAVGNKRRSSLDIPLLSASFYGKPRWFAMFSTILGLLVFAFIFFHVIDGYNCATGCLRSFCFFLKGGEEEETGDVDELSPSDTSSNEGKRRQQFRVQSAQLQPPMRLSKESPSPRFIPFGSLIRKTSSSQTSNTSGTGSGTGTSSHYGSMDWRCPQSSNRY